MSIVIRHPKTFMAVVVAGLAVALMGADMPPANEANAVTIFNPGDANYTGYAIAVESDGHAWTMDAAGRSQSFLPYALTQSLFTDLAAAGPLAQLTSRQCTARAGDQALQNIAGIYLVWRGQHSPNLQCASDARADRLLADAATIARSLYVHAYRTRPMAVFNTAGGYANAGAYQRGQPAGGSASSYTGAGSGANNVTGYSGSNVTGSSGPAYAGAYYTGENYTAAPGAGYDTTLCVCTSFAGPFASSPFSTNPYGSNPTSGSPLSSFGMDRFSSGFANSSFHNSLPINNSLTNNSVFSSSFGRDNTFSNSNFTGAPTSSSGPSSSFNNSFH